MRDDARDQRKLESLEWVAGQPRDRARFGQHAVRIPIAGVDDIGDAALRRNDEELVVVEEVGRAHAAAN